MRQQTIDKAPLLFSKILILCITVIMLASLMMTGCQKKVITVADDILSEDGSGAYLEIASFEVKDTNQNNREEIGSCAILIPEGYVKSSDVPGMYISENAPLDSSNIYYTVTDAQTVGAVNDNLTESDYEKSIEGAFFEEGKRVDISVDSFVKADLEGVPCFKVRTHYSLGETDVQQLVYIILANNTHVITYSQAGDDELLADFMTDEGQIRLIKEVSMSEEEK